jgi:hypothetical protein
MNENDAQKPGSQVDWAQLATEAMEDRRRCKRVKLRYEIAATITGPDGKRISINTFTQDISQNGCSFAVDCRMSTGDTGELKVRHRDGRGKLAYTEALPFRVAWSRYEGNLWLIGAEMNEIAPPWGVQFPPKGAAPERADRS